MSYRTPHILTLATLALAGFLVANYPLTTLLVILGTVLLGGLVYILVWIYSALWHFFNEVL